MNIIKKKSFRIAALLVIAVLAAFYLFGRGGGGVGVRAMTASKTDITKTVSMSGSVEPVSSEIITVQQGLKVLKVLVSENETVEPGQIIAELDSSDLRLSLEKTSLSLEQIEDELGTLKNTSISSDQAILKNALDRAKEDYNKAVADASKGAQDLAAYKVLLDEGAISKSEYDNRVSAQSSLEAYRNTSLLNYEDATLRYSQFVKSSSDGVQGLDRQRQSILLDMELLQNSINDTIIKSNISGKVVDLPLEEGREVPTGAEIIIHGSEGLEFVSYVNQEESLLIKEGQKASVDVPGSGKTYDGSVSFVGRLAKVEPASGSRTPKVEIRILLGETDDKVLPGFDADALVSTDSSKGVLSVKTEAIRYDESNSPFVYVISGSKAVKTPVVLGISDGYIVEIKSGLNENDQVILNPQMEISDGTEVSILK